MNTLDLSHDPMAKPDGAPMLPELQPDNLSDQVFEAIRAAIVNKSIAPGTRLIEATLARQMNVSKTPVREAILRLRELGLLEPDTRRGGRVVQPSLKAIEDVYDIREALEVFTASRAAECASDASLDRISAAASASLAAARAADLFVYRESDRQFHHTIVEALANERLTRILGNAFELMVTLRNRDVSDLEVLWIACGEAHVSIASAIAGRAPHEAARLMRTHIRQVKAHVIAGLPEEPILVDDARAVDVQSADGIHRASRR